jgi:hypothetical protein
MPSTNGKVLKVSKYRGERIYVRFLFGRTYEVLTTFKASWGILSVFYNSPLDKLMKGVHVQWLNHQKEQKHERKLSIAERDAAMLDEGLRCGIQCIDNFYREWEDAHVMDRQIRKVVNLIELIKNYVSKKRKRFVAARQRRTKPRSGIPDGHERSEHEEIDGSTGAPSDVHEPVTEG